MKSLKLITSWDDYSQQNIELSDLLKKYNIPAIFFIPCQGKEAWTQIKYFNDIGFEIGSHTINHEILRPCDFETQRYEIEESKRLLEACLDKKIDWFCYPRGRYDDVTKKIVEGVGYKYARTTKIGKIDNKKRFELNTTLHVFPRKEYNGVSIFDFFKKALQDSEDGDTIHIWGHAKEIDMLSLWNTLEDIFRYLAKLESKNEIVFSK